MQASASVDVSGPPPGVPRQAAVTSATQPVLGPWLRAQALNVRRHVSALRDFRADEFGRSPQAPSEGHIAAVNRLIGELRGGLILKAAELGELVEQALARPTAALLQDVVAHKHDSHQSVRQIEKVWDFYLELFGQRQSRFGPWLLGADRIALDCYQDAYMGIGVAKSIPAPAPFNYMRTGFGPATYRRGIKLSHIGKELNPFPLIQLPYHRLVNPWTLGAIMHEVSHNLHSDLGLSRAVPLAIGRRLSRAGLSLPVVRIWMRWNREMFADLSALLQGGPAVIASLMDVVGIAPRAVLHFNPDGVHPTPYLRVPLSIELLRRMGFRAEAERYARAWRALYPSAGDALPAALLQTAERAIELVVDAVCYQPYPELGGKSLANVFQFGQKEQRMVEETARRLALGNDPGIVPERFLIGAARFALDNRLATPSKIRANFYRDLERR
jgi:hypothetical protein